MPIGINKVSRNSQIGTAIPDTSMFQNPIYQWTASSLDVQTGNTVSEWSDEISQLTATANNTPNFADQSGFASVNYSASDNEWHTIPSDGQLPTGDVDVSVASLVYPKSTLSSGRGVIFAYGDSQNDEGVEWRLNSGQLYVEAFGRNLSVRSGSYNTDEWQTFCGRISTSDGGVGYINDSQTGTDSYTGSLDIKDLNRAIGQRTSDNLAALDGYVAEVVVCAGSESNQSFIDYYNDRLA